jgi:hypothetical protein
MHRLWRWRDVAGCVLALLLSHASLAQRLHFQSDEPKPGTGEVAMRLASEAREQFDALREQGGASAIKEAKQAYLAAAGLLLETGDNKGVGGTILVAAGTRLMRERDAVFALLDARKLDDNAARLLASDLGRIVQEPTATQASLDRMLRDAFANLLQATRSEADRTNLWPWPEKSDAAPPAWPEMSKLGTDAAAMDALRKRCELAEQWIAFRPGARAMMRVVMDASWPIGHEKQVPAGVYRRWITELTQGASEVVGQGAGEAMKEQQGEIGLARLQRLAMLGRIFAILDALAPDPGAKQLEKALFAAVEVMPDDPSATAGWTKLEHWLELAAERTTLMDDKSVVRQLRPALRSIGELAKGSNAELFESLARVATKPDASGDPGVMAAVNLFAENVQLLDVLHRASEAIEDPAAPPNDPIGRENAKPFTDGLLKLAKEVADPKQRDRSLGALRNLATDVADLMELPGEKRLREKSPELETLLRGKSTDALALIDRERGAWRRGVGAVMKPGATSGGENNAARLRAIGIVLALAVDAAECEAVASDNNDALQRWGGWWLDDAALQSYAADAGKSLPAMMKEMETDLATNVLATAQRFGNEHSVVAVAARVSRELARASADPSQTNPFRGVRAIATGSPDPQAVLLATWRERLSTICRYAQESASGESDAKRFATNRAADLLTAMERDEK